MPGATRISNGEKTAFDRYMKYLSPSLVANRLANLIPRSKYPPMGNGVREFLQRLYAKENIGLGQLIEADIERCWPYMKQGAFGTSMRLR